MADNSGQGAGTPVPPELRGWSWAGFLMNGFWAIPHRVWTGIVLCLLLPCVGKGVEVFTGLEVYHTAGHVLQLIGAIVLGIKGNAWAWQNRRWESVQQFRDTQRVWVIWGLVLVGAMIAAEIIWH